MQISNKTEGNGWPMYNTANMPGGSWLKRWQDLGRSLRDTYEISMYALEIDVMNWDLARGIMMAINKPIDWTKKSSYMERYLRAKLWMTRIWLKLIPKLFEIIIGTILCMALLPLAIILAILLQLPKY